VHIGVCAALEHCFHRCSAPGTADHANAALPSSLDASSISRNVTARSDPRFRYSATAKPSTATCRMLCFGPCGQGLIAWTTQAVTSDADGNRREKHAADDAEYSGKAALKTRLRTRSGAKPLFETPSRFHPTRTQSAQPINPGPILRLPGTGTLATVERNATQLRRTYLAVPELALLAGPPGFTLGVSHAVGPSSMVPSYCAGSDRDRHTATSCTASAGRSAQQTTLAVSR
jgi:hypothetical protein